MKAPLDWGVFSKQFKMLLHETSENTLTKSVGFYMRFFFGCRLLKGLAPSFI
jgi:hypothetical protein